MPTRSSKLKALSHKASDRVFSYPRSLNRAIFFNSSTGALPRPPLHVRCFSPADSINPLAIQSHFLHVGEVSPYGAISQAKYAPTPSKRTPISNEYTTSRGATPDGRAASTAVSPASPDSTTDA